MPRQDGTTAAPQASRSLRQLVSFGVVGLASNFAGYLVYLLLTSFTHSPKLTMTALYAVGTTVSYLGNRNWTFARRGGGNGVLPRYLAAHGTGYALNLGLLYCGVDVLGYPHQLVQAVAIFVVAGAVYLLLDRFVFPKERPGGRP